MIDKWEKGTSKDFYCSITENWPSDLAKHNAWNGPSRNSSGICRHIGAVKEPVKVDVFPAAVQKEICRVSAIYSNLLAGTHEVES